MWEKLKNNILQITEVAGIELMTNQDGSYFINVALVTLQNNELVKKAEWFNLKSIEDLTGKLSIKVPVTLTFTGKNVLVKSIPARENITNYIAEIFPQTNPNEFYHSVTKQQEHLFVSIARKEFIDKIIDDLVARGYKVLDLNLAFFDIVTILPYLNHEATGVIEIPAYSIQYNKDYSISSFESAGSKLFDLFSQKEYAIASQYIKAPVILPFAAASKFIAGSIVSKQNITSHKIASQREEYRYLKYFVAASWVFLVGLFSLLLINFGIYSYYFSSNKEITALQTISQDQVAQLKNKEKEIKRKERFLLETGWIKPSKTSYFADRIASLLTSDLYLTSLQVYPSNNAVLSEKKETAFKKDTIQISGNCTEPLELNQFTNNLKNLAEIKEVTVKNYLYKKENDNASFLIEIITR